MEVFPTHHMGRNFIQHYCCLPSPIFRLIQWLVYNGRTGQCDRLIHLEKPSEVGWVDSHLLICCISVTSYNIHIGECNVNVQGRTQATLIPTNRSPNGCDVVAFQVINNLFQSIYSLFRCKRNFMMFGAEMFGHLPTKSVKINCDQPNS